MIPPQKSLLKNGACLAINRVVPLRSKSSRNWTGTSESCIGSYVTGSYKTWNTTQFINIGKIYSNFKYALVGPAFVV